MHFWDIFQEEFGSIALARASWYFETVEELLRHLMFIANGSPVEYYIEEEIVDNNLCININTVSLVFEATN